MSLPPWERDQGRGGGYGHAHPGQYPPMQHMPPMMQMQPPMQQQAPPRPPPPCPPPSNDELRKTIETTSAYFVRAGRDLEAKVRREQQGNPKFAFLFGGEGSDYFHFRMHCAILGYDEATIARILRDYLGHGQAEGSRQGGQQQNPPPPLQQQQSPTHQQMPQQLPVQPAQQQQPQHQQPPHQSPSQRPHQVPQQGMPQDVMPAQIALPPPQPQLQQMHPQQLQPLPPPQQMQPLPPQPLPLGPGASLMPAAMIPTGGEQVPAKVEDPNAPPPRLPKEAETALTRMLRDIDSKTTTIVSVRKWMANSEVNMRSLVEKVVEYALDDVEEVDRKVLILYVLNSLVKTSFKASSSEAGKVGEKAKQADATDVNASTSDEQQQPNVEKHKKIVEEIRKVLPRMMWYLYRDAGSEKRRLLRKLINYWAEKGIMSEMEAKEMEKGMKGGDEPKKVVYQRQIDPFNPTPAMISGLVSPKYPYAPIDPTMLPPVEPFVDVEKIDDRIEDAMEMFEEDMDVLFDVLEREKKKDMDTAEERGSRRRRDRERDRERSRSPAREYERDREWDRERGGRGRRRSSSRERDEYDSRGGVEAHGYGAESGMRADGSSIINTDARMGLGADDPSRVDEFEQYRRNRSYTYHTRTI